MFVQLDSDGSGTLSREEFQAATMNRSIRRRLQAMDFDDSQMDELFAILDDGDGELSIEELKIFFL